MSKGGRNLIILGVISALIALATTGVSLAVYHNSGDIYLDRSRPGYLPDEEEIEQDNDDTDDDYLFSKSGEINKEVLEEYLKNLETEIQAIDAYEKPFDADALNNKALGIEEERLD